MKCPRCQQDNPAEHKFCKECGTSLAGASHARPYADLKGENEGLRRSLGEAYAQVTEALKQQTATSEILGVISSSPTDVQPVFDAIVRNGMRLTGAARCVLFGFDGEMLSILAMHNVRPEGIEMIQRIFPRPASRHSAMGRAVLDRTIAHIPDVTLDPEFGFQEAARAVDFRAVLAVPTIRGGAPIGTIVVQRSEPGAFSDSQIQLLKTFADQAVIAIENVRLFTELQARNRQLTEALEQQTATGEILRVISRSATDVQPVFAAIAESALHLCDGVNSVVGRYDGDLLHLAAHAQQAPEAAEALRRTFPMRPSRATASGRAVLEGAVVHIPDVQADPAYAQPLAEVIRVRSTVAVPMLRDGQPIGTIAVGRSRPFSDKHIALLQTFADQAVIAIENVRLFNETKEALEQQTATAQILRVISSSPTDIQPVLDVVTATAARVCGATDALTMRVEGQGLRRVAHFGPIPLVLPAVRPLTAGSVSGRAIVEGRTIHIHDILATEAARDYPEAQPADAGAQWRTMLAVPLVREGASIGAILIRRTETRPFTGKEIQLLETFASQAVIAIENVRLFTELQEKNQALTEAHAQISEALEQQTATSEILRVIASSPTDLQPVLDALAESASRLCRSVDCNIFLPDGDRLVLRARYGPSRGEADVVGQFVLALVRGTVAGRTVLERRTVHVIDLLAEADEFPEAHQNARRFGFRTMLSVPLIRESAALGVIQLRRTEVNPFTDRQAELLKTFADQAVIAIENARLFLEIEDKSRQLEAASRHKSEFLANMSHELRTPLNAVIGFSEVLTEGMFGELNEKQDEYLKDINASGQHLLSLINDILDLSKIEAGRMELELTDFNLPATLDNALTLVRERAGRRGIALGLTVDERLEQIHADERKVRQVVLNLLSNAIKFTPEGGRIEVRAVPGDGMVEISVSDTGVGIAPEDQEAIFEEFRQVGTAAKKVEGTGLGLALSRKFIELHGGRIWVQSQVGVGSTFTFAIPIRSDA